MRRQVFADATGLGEAVAAEIAERVAAAEGDFLLGCPSGRTPRPVYAGLTRLARQGRFDPARVVVVMMDEFLVETGDGPRWAAMEAHYSCRGFAVREIAAPWNDACGHRALTPERIWAPDPADPQAYDARIEAAGGIGYFILASGGGDGHVAFNPPGSPRDSRSRIIALAEQTRRDNLGSFPEFRSLEEVPRRGVSVGIDTIARTSRAAAMLLVGAGKRTAFDRITRASAYDPDWPATIVVECRGASLYADREAAG